MNEKFKNDLRVVKEQRLHDGVIYNELLNSKGVFIERYYLLNKKPSLEILIFSGLNVLSGTKYYADFPCNLCKETDANVSVVYQIGCGVKLNRHFRRFTQEEAEGQYIAGFELVRNFEKKVIIFSHSASTIEHIKLIFGGKYKNYSKKIAIVGGIIASPVADILLELKKIWPNYKFLNWRNIMKIGSYFNLLLPVYPFYNKIWHTQSPFMNNLSIWINSKTANFLLNTNVKKIILNGKESMYPLLVFITKRDLILNPARQEDFVKHMYRKAKIKLVRCDAGHNLFLSFEASHILKTIKKYVNDILINLDV